MVYVVIVGTIVPSFLIVRLTIVRVVAVVVVAAAAALLLAADDADDEADDRLLLDRAPWCNDFGLAAATADDVRCTAPLIDSSVGLMSTTSYGIWLRSLSWGIGRIRNVTTDIEYVFYCWEQRE